MKLYGPLVYSWCRRSGTSDEDARDLVQLVFAKVFAGLDGFRKDRPSDTFRGWLRTITRNTICDHIRAGGKHVLAAGGTEAWQRMENVADPATDDDSVAISDDKTDLAARALMLIRDEFPERAMQAFQLTALRGLNSTEAAARLKTTPEAVRKAKSRVLRRLREELGEVE